MMKMATSDGSPFLRVPEQGPGWFLVAIEACGGGTPDLWCSWMFSGYMGIYRRKKYISGAARGPPGWRARLPPGRALPPRGPVVAPSTYFFLQYMFTHPANIQEHHETLFPPPQPSVPQRSHLGAFFGAPPEGGINHGGPLHQLHGPSDDV